MLAWLESHSNDLLFGVLLGSFALAACWEALWPRRKIDAATVRRWPHNIALGLVNQALVNWLGVAVAVVTAWYVQRGGGGLLGRFDVGVAGQLVITFLAFDLLGYGLHRLMHANRWLWRLHTVHHSDTELDFSTTYRNHPVETAISVLASVPLVLLLGPAPGVILVYQAGRVMCNVLAHSNLYLPEIADRWLRYLVVTPDYHRVHHHVDPQFTNSNYATFLPLYDYLFRTARRVPFAAQPSLPVGLEYFRQPADSRFLGLLWMPFRRR